jgi:hypothetical protein
MKPKERAAYLILKYMSIVVEQDLAKECALIAVDEILSIGCVEVPYWYEVKQEIETL